MPTDAASRRAHRLPQPRDRVALAGGALAVSPICLGMVRDPAAISAGFDAGINFVFVTADMHWPEYEATRRGLADLLARGGGVRDRLVVAVVSYAVQPEFCRAPFEEVLRALPGLDRIDLLVAGGAYGWELERRWPVYLQHRATRFAGAAGVAASFHDRALAGAAIRDGRVDLAFVRYNAAHPGARTDVMPHVDGGRVPLFGFTSTRGYVSPERARACGIDDETWTPRVVDHYRFALTRPQMAGLLVAPADVGELGALCDALALGPLDPDEEDHVIALAALARGVPGVDPAQARPRTRG